MTNIIDTVDLQDIIDAVDEYVLPVDYEDDGYTLAKDSCRFLGEFMRRVSPHSVVEFGSGVSSSVIAHALWRNGRGVLHSFDHMAVFLAAAEEPTAHLGLSEWARFYRCPIRPGLFAGKPLWFYYIPDRTWKEIGLVDVVVVDGPPGFWGREAALYTAWPHLRVGGYILLDDAKRPGEVRTVEQWRQRYGDALICFHLEMLERGMTVCRKTRGRPAGATFGVLERCESFVDTIKRLMRNRRRLRHLL